MEKYILWATKSSDIFHYILQNSVLDLFIIVSLLMLSFKTDQALKLAKNTLKMYHGMALQKRLPVLCHSEKRKEFQLSRCKNLGEEKIFRSKIIPFCQIHALMTGTMNSNFLKIINLSFLGRNTETKVKPEEVLKFVG